MTDSIKGDILYFKTLPYEEIFRFFNNLDTLKVVLFEKNKYDFCYYSNPEEKYVIVLNKHRMKEYRKKKMIYFYGKILEGYIVPIAEQMKEPLKSKIEKYNAEFTALYNK